MKSYKVSVGSTRVLLVAADDKERTIYLHHDNDNEIVFIGDSEVTTSNGFHLHKLETLSFVLPFKETLYAIKDDSGDAVDIFVLTPDVD